MANVVMFGTLCSRAFHLQGDMVNTEFLFDYSVETAHKQLRLSLIARVDKYVGRKGIVSGASTLIVSLVRRVRCACGSGNAAAPLFQPFADPAKGCIDGLPQSAI